MARVRVKANRHDRNRWCRWFGHIFDGYHGATPYGRVFEFSRDGCAVVHCVVRDRCDRCGQSIAIVNFHMPHGWKGTKF